MGTGHVRHREKHPGSQMWPWSCWPHRFKGREVSWLYIHSKLIQPRWHHHTVSDTVTNGWKMLKGCIVLPWTIVLPTFAWVLSGSVLIAWRNLCWYFGDPKGLPWGWTLIEEVKQASEHWRSFSSWKALIEGCTCVNIHNVDTILMHHAEVKSHRPEGWMAVQWILKVETRLKTRLCEIAQDMYHDLWYNSCTISGFDFTKQHAQCKDWLRRCLPAAARFANF